MSRRFHIQPNWMIGNKFRHPPKSSVTNPREKTEPLHFAPSTHTHNSRRVPLSTSSTPTFPALCVHSVHLPFLRSNIPPPPAQQSEAKRSEAKHRAPQPQSIASCTFPNPAPDQSSRFHQSFSQSTSPDEPLHARISMSVSCRASHRSLSSKSVCQPVV